MSEFKAFPFECKVNLDLNTFEGYFSIKGNVDDGNDRVMAGAFTKTFQENKKRIKGLYMHDFYKPFSKPIELYEDSKGAFVKGSISLCSWGQDLKVLMSDGVVDEMSFGYDAVKYDYVNEGKDKIRNLREVKCWEYSPITWGMNNATSINSVKKLDTLEKMLDEIKVGRAISNRSKESIQQAIDALMALIMEIEPDNQEMGCTTQKPEKSLKNINDIDPLDMQSIIKQLQKYK